MRPKPQLKNREKENKKTKVKRIILNIIFKTNSKTNIINISIFYNFLFIVKQFYLKFKDDKDHTHHTFI